MTAPLPDQLLEEEIRAMLQRRAQDVNPEPPPWRELAQRNGAVVISLRTGAPVDTATGRRRRPSRQWFRGVLAAAVALILAMVGALLVQGSGPNSGDSADGPEPLDVPSAGQGDFNAASATPLFPVTNDQSPDIVQYDYLDDPITTAEQYLGSVGLPAGTEQLVVDNPVPQSTTTSEGEPPIETATVAWSVRAKAVPQNPPLSQGQVFLRNPGRGGRDTWLVVGAYTKTLWVTDIRRDDDQLSFTVDRSTETETFQDDLATVRIDRDVVAEVGYGEIQPIRVNVPAGQVATIRVQHVEDGMPMSITSTAVPAVPGAPVEPLDRVPVPTTAAAGRAAGVAAQLGALAESLAQIEVRSGPLPEEPPVPDRAEAVVVLPVEPVDPVVAEREAVSRR